MAVLTGISRFTCRRLSWLRINAHKKTKNLGADCRPCCWGCLLLSKMWCGKWKMETRQGTSTLNEAMPIIYMIYVRAGRIYQMLPNLGRTQNNTLSRDAKVLFLQNFLILQIPFVFSYFRKYMVFVYIQNMVDGLPSEEFSSLRTSLSLN